MQPYRKARAAIRSLVQYVVFEVSFRRFLRLADAQRFDEKLLADLIFGWGNAGYSAEPAYLRASLLTATTTCQPVLECGSGLSTLLLGAVAARTGNLVWSLEHHAAWAKRVSGHLQKWNIHAANCCSAPLYDYGQFVWYDVSGISLPDSFGLVVCDGPPENTFGGRYGLLPVMHQHLAHNCLILLDDFKRTGEQRAAQRWQEIFSCTVEAHESQRGYATITVP
jgi:hypothetical protein